MIIAEILAGLVVLGIAVGLLMDDPVIDVYGSPYGEN